MWNGFSMINKTPELTEGMMQTLVEAERSLLEAPGIASLFQTVKQEHAVFHVCSWCLLRPLQ